MLYVVNKIIIMKKLKKGFWAGLLAFILARFSHLLITALIGLQIALFYPNGVSEFAWTLIAIIDSPVVGLLYIVPMSIYIYKLITK